METDGHRMKTCGQNSTEDTDFTFQVVLRTSTVPPRVNIQAHTIFTWNIGVFQTPFSPSHPTPIGVDPYPYGVGWVGVMNFLRSMGWGGMGPYKFLEIWGGVDRGRP